MCIVVCMDMRMDLCMDMGMGMCLDMGMGMCMGRSKKHMYGHVYEQVY